MRLAYVVHKFPPESVGGVEVYTWSLGRSLAAMGHEVHVFYPLTGLDPGEAHVERDGIHLWRVPLAEAEVTEGPVRQFWHTFRNARVEADFQRFLSQVQPDLVHFQHVQGVSARLIGMAKGRPRVVTLQDYWFFCANSQLLKPDAALCDGPKHGWNCVDCATMRADLGWLRSLRPLVALPFVYRNWYLRRALRAVDLFLVPSDWARCLYLRQGLPEARVALLEYGLNLDRMAPTGRKFASPAARPHFGFLGSIAWQKGVHVLIEAFNQLPDCASLTIYGDDTVFPVYSAKTRAASRHPHVRFAGVVDYQHIGDALRELDYLVVPSLWPETFCMVVQEAHAVGVPVVASRLGPLERVRDGETGRLFTAGDSAELARVLRDLIEHPDMRAELRANLRPGPTIEQQAHRIAEAYQALIEGKRPDVLALSAGENGATTPGYTSSAKR
jgi:glycosyltransferase involved in cell wall biosynthesis